MRSSLWLLGSACFSMTLACTGPDRGDFPEDPTGTSSTAGTSTGSSSSTSSGSTASSSDGGGGSGSGSGSGASGSTGGSGPVGPGGGGGSDGNVGGGGGQGPGGGGGGGGASCDGNAECDDLEPCTHDTCVEGHCANTAIADGPFGIDQPGDCFDLYCDSGVLISLPDDTEDAVDANPPCETTSCLDGEKVPTFANEGTPCGTDPLECDGNGFCVGCEPGDIGVCGSDTACAAPTCVDPGTCDPGFLPTDTVLADPFDGDCQRPECTGDQPLPESTTDNADLPQDLPCGDGECVGGVAGVRNLTVGEPCNVELGVCDGEGSGAESCRTCLDTSDDVAQADAGCAPERPLCDQTADGGEGLCRTCVNDQPGSATDTGCSAGTPYCDPSADGGVGACGSGCVDSNPGAAIDLGCDAADPICDTSLGVCHSNTTWDTSWSPGLTYSGGALSIAGNFAGPNRSARTTVGRSGGKFYWELSVTAGSGQGGGLGIVEAAHPSDASFIGSVPSGFAWGYICCVQQYSINWAGASIASGNPPLGSEVAAGRLYMLALDMDTGQFWAGQNGTWYNAGNPAASTSPAVVGLDGTVYPGVDFFSNSNHEYTANFGAQPFAYPVPTGFAAGFY